MTTELALSQSFTASGQSSYLRSLLEPRYGPSSIPDETLEPHMLKSVSSQYNIQSPASGSGVFLFNMNHPGTYVGAHYVEVGGNLQYERTINLSDDLSEDFDYARRQSAVIEVSSSSISSTNFTLNGVFAAAQYTGEFSELDKSQLDYDSVLALNSGVDKVESVAIHDGVTALFLPVEFNNPMYRINERETPQVLIGSVVNSYPLKINSSRNLVYTVTQAITATDVPSGDTGFREVFTIPSVEGVNVNGVLQFALPGTGVKTITARMLVLDIVGATVRTIEFTGRVEDGMDVYLMPIGATLKVDNPGSRRPLTKVYFEVLITNSTGSNQTYTVYPNLTLTSISGTDPGNVKNMIIVAYTGLSEGTQINLSGRFNFEMVPGFHLAKNVRLQHAPYDPREIEYARQLLANRHRLGIRTVMKRSEYQSMIPMLKTLPDVNNQRAYAFDWGNLVRVIRRLIAPTTAAIGAFNPGVARMIAPVTSSIDQALLDAGFAYTDDEERRAWDLGEDDAQEAWAADGPIYFKAGHIDMSPKGQWEVRNLPHRSVRKATLFPTVIMDTSSPVPVATRIEVYAVFPVSASHQQPGPIGLTANGRRVYNYRGDQLPLHTPCDIGMAKVLSVTNRGYLLANTCAPVTGHSCMVAIGLLSELVRRGEKSWVPTNLAFTGSYTKDWAAPEAKHINPNIMANSKLLGCHALGFYLAANDASADRQIYNLADALRVLQEYSSKVPYEEVKGQEEELFNDTVFAFAAGYDEIPDLEEYQEELTEESLIKQIFGELHESAVINGFERAKILAMIMKNIFEKGREDDVMAFLTGRSSARVTTPALGQIPTVTPGKKALGNPAGSKAARIKQAFGLPPEAVVVRGPTATEVAERDFSKLSQPLPGTGGKKTFSPAVAAESAMQQIFGTSREYLSGSALAAYDKFKPSILKMVTNTKRGLTADEIQRAREAMKVTVQKKGGGRGQVIDMSELSQL